jgi:hypothetical protein
MPASVSRRVTSLMRLRFHQTNQLVANAIEELSRQVRIGDSTGEIERSEQSAQNKQGTSALIPALV